MKCRRFVRLAHIPSPLGMKVKTSLDTSFFRFGRFVTSIPRINVTFKYHFAVSDGVSVDGARLN